MAALLFTGLSLQQTRQQNQLEQSGQITDRFNAAVTNLGSSTQTIRIGGIYALQRIMQDSPRDQPAVIQVLAAFVRGNVPPSAASSTGINSDTDASAPATPTAPHKIDIQSALAVLGARDPSHDQGALIDLDGADLAGVVLTNSNFHVETNLGSQFNPDAGPGGTNFTGADFSDANLSGAQFRGVVLTGANLANANLAGANLSSASLSGANLTLANLTSADLTQADLARANLGCADFTGADLTQADLTSANLTSADLGCADFTGSDLTQTNLTDVDLKWANLTGADLFGAILSDVSWCSRKNPTKPGGYECVSG